MRDETLVRMLEDACRKLEHVHFPAETPHLAPIYNGLLAAARANHPDHVFLNVLAPLAPDARTGPEELNVLFGQLRILLEALTEEGSRDSGMPPQPSSPPPPSPHTPPEASPEAALAASP